ncbi:hypothetical protein RYX36_033504 [Vicia faba]
MERLKVRFKQVFVCVLFFGTKTVQDGKLFIHLNSLVVAQLRHNNLTQAATVVASATMTPLNVEAPPNKLLELVAKVLT